MSPVIRSLMRYLISSLICFFMLIAIHHDVQADGIVIPEPPPYPDMISLEENWLTIRYHQVDVIIEDQIATTRVNQEFVNHHDWEVEGTYIFPIPEGASITEFIMWMDGKPIEGQILQADEARKIYEDVVRERRDPALLEYVGQDAVQARIYPIPAGESRKIELEYTQVLQKEAGLVKYIYPLNTEKFSAQPLENCSVSVEINSKIPLRTLYSPTHQDRIFVERDGDQRAIVSYEEQNVLPDQDFELIYTVSREDVGLSLLIYPDDQTGLNISPKEGYFLLMASPTMEVDRIVPRDVVLVLDTSGSMEGDKLDQAKSAASYVLKHLNEEDRFNVIAFSTGIHHFAYDLQSRSRVDEAISWLAKLPALGGTNINLALLEALALNNAQDDIQPDRPMVLLFLTDGLPTEGITDIYQIIENVTGSADKNHRLFVFGVGDDVNTELLDTLATENRGQVQYVRPGEKIDEEVSNLYARIRTPVLTNLNLDFGDIMVDEAYPAVLPDLYSGSQLIVTGRYRLPSDSTGKTWIKLSGQVNSRTDTYIYQADFGKDQKITDANAYIPRLWATRKIGYLLNQIRYQGENPKWVDAIIQLSLRYGIITPYTSFLIEEHDVFTAEGLDQAADELAEIYSGPAVGAEAVNKADAESNLRSAESISRPVISEKDSGQMIRESAIKYIADKTFLFQDGVWIDSQYNPAEWKPVKISMGSDVYFDLLSTYSSLGKIFSLGGQVIFVFNGDAYEIVTDEEGVSSLPQIYNQEQEPSEIDRISEEKVSFSRIFRSICSGPFFTGLVLILYPWRK